MKRARQHPTTAKSDFDAALEFLEADALRLLVRNLALDLDTAARDELSDLVLERAARSGWRPGRDAGVAIRAAAFAKTATKTGFADPEGVDRHLRSADRAFFACDYETARGAYQPLFEMLGRGDVDLGQHELYEDVLTVGLHASATRFLAATVVVSDPSARVDALRAALQSVRDVARFHTPLREIERVLDGKLPDESAFLRGWASKLERSLEPPHATEWWDREEEVWLREVLERIEGPAGLARVARKMATPSAYRAWCHSLYRRRDWQAALAAFTLSASKFDAEEAGGFLDGAVRSARRLGQDDTTLLQEAWRASPTVARLLRYLDSGSVSGDSLRRRVRRARSGCPKTLTSAIGLLELLAGEIAAAANILERAPGLGWSRPEHPGPVLFSAFVRLLRVTAPGFVGAQIAAVIETERTGDSFRGLGPQDFPEDPLERELLDELPIPAEATILDRSALSLSAAHRTRISNSLRTAAQARTEAALANARRSDYAHAASLVACVAEIESSAGRSSEAKAWLAAIEKRANRHRAYRAELRAALCVSLPHP